MAKFIFVKPTDLTPSASYLFKKGTIVSGKTITDTRPNMNGGYTTITSVVFNNGGLDFRVVLTSSVINPYNQKDKYEFASSVNLKSITPTSFDKGTIVNGNIVNVTRPTPNNGTMMIPTLNFNYNGLDFSVVVPKNNPVVQPYNVKNISNKLTEYSSSVDGQSNSTSLKKSKYKVVKEGFNYNGNVLKLGEIFEGVDSGAKFLDSPAITITYLGQSVNVPKENLVLVGDSDKVTDTKVLEDYNSKRNTIKSITKVVGLGGGLFLAHKMKKGTWGYMAFGLLGIIAGTFVGGQIANIVIKD